jgi:SpoVK/Ycf46/Vps4 family AAA+-type ATPase
LTFICLSNLYLVFLRILEYYDGILILTSNRVGIFDEAFKSRIQVSLHYEDHTASVRKAIWKNFFNILESSGANANIGELEDHLEELAQEEMNGRQIRNAVTTARQLALHQKQRLDWAHLEQALLTAKEFDRYLKKVQGGHSDKQWARDNRWR